MKNLYNFILEAADNSSKKFNNVAKTLNDLPKELNIFNELVPDEVRNVFQTIMNSQNHDTPILFATGAAYFKMPYCYDNSIRENLKDLTGIELEEQGIKTFVFYRPSGNGKRIKLMETGNGSLKKIPTDFQENTTCFVFNAYMDVIAKEQLEPGKSEDIDKQFVEDLISGSNIDSSWVSSFVYQVKTIVDYLTSLNMDKKTISNYRLARYGAQSDDEPVSKSYSKMVKKYSSILGGRKDAYDPTDILLFNKLHADQIKACCEEAYSKLCSTNPDKTNEAKTEFLEKIFKENLCMGISLKKLSKQGKIELFNIDGNEGVIKSVTGFRNNPPKRGNYAQVYCQGNFQFSEGFTDEDGDRLNNTKEIMLTLRTFGSNIIGMDVNLSKNDKAIGPAIGKCPVNIWREVLGIGSNQEKNIQTCIDRFNEFLKTSKEDDVLTGLKTIIQGAVKEGPSCFPFILLH